MRPQNCTTNRTLSVLPRMGSSF